MAPPCGFSLSLNGSTPSSRGRDDLGREGLVDFHHVHVIDGHLGPGQRLPAGLDRAQAHHLGLQGADAGRHDAGERGDPELVGEGP